MYKEMKQLDDRTCYLPLKVDKMTTEEKVKVEDAIVLLTEKRDGTIKARSIYNRKDTRDWIWQEDSVGPTVSQESIVITAVIDMKEGRDIIMVNVPNEPEEEIVFETNSEQKSDSEESDEDPKRLTLDQQEYAYQPYR